MNKISVILAMMGQVRDRFGVYGENRTLAQRLDLASRVEGIDGVEMVYPFEFEDVKETSRLLKAHDLVCSSVNVNAKTEAKFHGGSFTSPNPEVRAEAVGYLTEAMDVAATMGCFMVTVCPLADGHDYPFEVDYRQAWRWLREGIGAAAQHRTDVKISLEYKRSEVRTHVVLGSAGVALHLCHQIGLPNVGVTFDIGHALFTGETPAQVVALLADARRLFLVHVNDNYRDFDWDMIPGTVNLWDWLETLLYLDAVGYEGWLTSDVSPGRQDPYKVADMTGKSIRNALFLLEKMGAQELWRLIREHDSMDVFAYVQDKLREG